MTESKVAVRKQLACLLHCLVIHVPEVWMGVIGEEKMLSACMYVRKIKICVFKCVIVQILL